MTVAEKHNRNLQLITYISVFLVWFVSNGINLTQDVSSSLDRYDISLIQLRFIQLLIALPILAIYLSIAYAAVSFTIYANRIKNTKEGIAYKLISRALFITFLSFLLNNVLSSMRTLNYGTSNTEFLWIDYVIQYSTVIMALLFYIILYKASNVLINTIENIKQNSESVLAIVIGLALISGGLIYFVYTNDNRTISNLSNVKATYGVNDISIFLTIIVPYIISWAFGLMAIMNLSLYAQNVKGIIYRAVFKNLSKGFGLIIALTIGMQFLTQVAGSLADASLNIILGIIIIILTILVIGYVFVANAAKKLDKIETT